MSATGNGETEGVATTLGAVDEAHARTATPTRTQVADSSAPAAVTKAVPGTVLAQKYKLRRLLGQGGMGSVWIAEHLSLGTDVAVKMIDPVIAQNPAHRERFVREARSAAGLRSQNVVQILDYGVDGDVPFIVMELLEGESLGDRLDREGHLVPGVAAKFITEVCRALARAHGQGIVHRDLKPDNIFLVRDPDGEYAKVLDFGIAKASGDESDVNTQTGTVLGTPYYMSPEQARNSKDVDSRSDLWAVGAIAYEAIVGRRPFEGELTEVILKICVEDLPVPSAEATVPTGFDAWFTRACARELDERFQSAKELASALRAVIDPDHAGASMSFSTGGTSLAGDPRQPTAPTVAAPPTAEALDPPVKSPLGLIVAVVIGALAIAGLAFALSRETPTPPPAADADAAGANRAAAVEPHAPAETQDAETPAEEAAATESGGTEDDAVPGAGTSTETAEPDPSVDPGDDDEADSDTEGDTEPASTDADAVPNRDAKNKKKKAKKAGTGAKTPKTDDLGGEIGL